MRSEQHNISIGRLGEEYAKHYLQKKGYVILEQNYRTRYAEIDLVTRDKNILVIVEVRTKTHEQFGTPEDTLTKRKLHKVYKNALAYAAHVQWEGLYRVDAVCIVWNSQNGLAARCSHYVDVRG
jgi:putative endonuclease